MFNLSKEVLSQVEQNISFKQAMKRKPKEGRSFIYTKVNWCKDSERLALGEIELLTIGKVQTLLPKQLNLPRGYIMSYHKVHTELCKKIYDESKKYSFEYMDNIELDSMTLYKECGVSWEFIDWEHENVREYEEYRRNRGNSWDVYYEKLDGIESEFAIKESRDFAPLSIIPQLEQMLTAAKERGL